MPSSVKKIFTSSLAAAVAIIPCSIISAQSNIQLKEAEKHVGETVSFCGTIISVKHLDNVKDKPTLINLGNVTQHLDVVIGTDNESIAGLIGDSLKFKDACITGKIYYFKGTEHVYLKAESIQLKETEIVASVAFKEKEPEQVSTPELLSATEKSNVRKKLVLYTKAPNAQNNLLLIKYIKLGKIISYNESRGKKTYVIQLKEYKKD